VTADADGRPKHVGHNQVVYSDDHGKTWFAGDYVNPKTGEGRDMPGAQSLPFAPTIFR
jgi:hypothetical protein